MSNLHLAVASRSKAMSSKSPILSTKKYPVWVSIIMIFLLVHLPSSFESASVEERRSEVWASARLRARAVDTPPKDCPGPKCKSSAAGGSANEEEDIHHRASVSTRSKSARSVRARDCKGEGKKDPSSTPPEKHRKKKGSEDKPADQQQQQQSQADATQSDAPKPAVQQQDDDSNAQQSEPPRKKSHKSSNSNASTAPTTSTPENSGSNTGDRSDRSRWLAAHNDIRRRYSVPDLVWDPKLEAVAQGHADTCIFKHSTSGYGENLAAGHPTLELVLEDWAFGDDECGSWDPAAADYSHFTQVVWKTAATVGCAVKKCATLPGVPFKLIDTFYYVCNYSGPLDAPTDFASNMHAKKGQCLKKPTPPNPTS
ncbi:uncharacterized protein PGTG_15146 [Puccinia graminis f. sp. tritici CRL 75-36-700-3]|uniref:SCP domain-containing protein n=1 Tax=Puccinia graminis f. sp. tritici (strain CRL 75-36-700-3 / race SCCL) TaxID=418459 RepID=E3KXI5_PUCGT|nr:uncharacterized protein PGTG_15146 [Puccinia graminis f. sp. tritici CRL 75-36-700-3]EFP88943.2 hypothetical protein PGTG_15146 [Puccinia graminis f. sp. tritici CRL 75-36-700-3]